MFEEHVGNPWLSPTFRRFRQRVDTDSYLGVITGQIEGNTQQKPRFLPFSMWFWQFGELNNGRFSDSDTCVIVGHKINGKIWLATGCFTLALRRKVCNGLTPANPSYTSHGTSGNQTWQWKSRAKGGYIKYIYIYIVSRREKTNWQIIYKW